MQTKEMNEFMNEKIIKITKELVIDISWVYFNTKKKSIDRSVHLGE